MKAARLSRFGPFTLDTNSRELSKNGIRIKLRGQPFLILETLLEHPGEVVTRDQIREKLWPADTFVDFEHGLNTSVKKLRQALCDSADEPRYIETLPRLGYRFIASVETAEAEAPPSANGNTEAGGAPRPIPAAEALPAPSRRAHDRRKWIGVAAAVGAGAILALSFALVPIVLRSLPPRDGETANKSGKRFTSIAVLPLENLSNDPTQEYFADGMTDELITDLAQLGTLRVISRTSVMRYKDSKKAVPQIGRELGVDALIEGTVERVGNRVRIRVQLIDTASDRHLWAQSYNRELKDVLSLQTAAARDIAQEIQGQTVAASQPTGSPRAVLPEAYEAYLEGQYFQNKRTDDALQKSITYFQQAIAQDPAFPQAYAGLAQSYSLLGSDVLPANVARPKAKAAARKALELDRTNVDGHTQLGLVEFYYDWNWQQAEQEFQQAIGLNPNNANAHRWYSYYLRAMGRFPEALEEAQKAQKLDPLSLSINTTVAGRYRDMHQFAQAFEENQRTLELDANFIPAHEALAALYEEQGQFPLAVGECKKALELSQNSPSTLANLGYAYAISGNRAEARRIASQLTAKQAYVANWDMAVLFAGLGDADRAFQWLAKSYQERESQMPFLQIDRRLTSLHADPRFRALVRQLGIPGGDS